ncbi:MAG: L,D-transpeptidase family protein [bacterium]
MNGLRALILAGGLAVSLAIALPVAATARQGDPPTADADAEATPPVDRRAPVPARIILRIEGAGDGSVAVGKRVKSIARMKPFVAGQEIVVMLTKGHKTIKKRKLRVKQVGHRDLGRVAMPSPRFIRDGKYQVKAFHEATPDQEAADKQSRRFGVKYPNLHPGQHGEDVQLFNRLLRRQGYYVSVGKGYGEPTKRAVMAFRKVNRMSRNFDATSGMFRRLADGKGSFRLARPGAGRHVEVDVSRQVMVLADHGRAQYIFHVSTGAPATPSDRGTYRFYRRQPGFNSIGMYYSVYYNRGEAIHGYHSVPPYNASHGCIRNPIPNSRFIYNWVSIGMQIFVYN